MAIAITIEMVKAHRAFMAAQNRPDTPPDRVDFNKNIELCNRIHLIKFVRTYTDLGLKEAKDVVDEHTIFAPMSGTGTGIKRLPLKKALSPIFDAYDLCIFDDNELDSPEARSVLMDVSVEAHDKILRGVATALETWKTMGYKNPYDACLMVIHNLAGHTVLFPK